MMIVMIELSESKYRNLNGVQFNISEELVRGLRRWGSLDTLSHRLNGK